MTRERRIPTEAEAALLRAVIAGGDTFAAAFAIMRTLRQSGWVRVTARGARKTWAINRNGRVALQEFEAQPESRCGDPECQVCDAGPDAPEHDEDPRRDDGC